TDREWISGLNGSGGRVGGGMRQVAHAEYAQPAIAGRDQPAQSEHLAAATRDGGVDLPVGETGDGLAGDIPHLHREQCRHRTVTMSEWSVTRCTMNPTELAPVRHIVRGRGD